MTLEEIYESKLNDNSDICQHLPTLKEYASGCNIVVELGVRSIVSTWAFLMGKPHSLISLDIKHPSYYKDYDAGGCDLELVHKLAKKHGVDFTFIEADSLKAIIPYCDLIFFDTLHTYEQLSMELLLHGNKSNKYLIFHDTVSYAEQLMPAIQEFMFENKHWIIDKQFDNNNGLLILKRI